MIDTESKRPHLSRILLVNDDGIHAEGLKISEAIASEFADEVWVVAPAADQSGMSHALSLQSPIRVVQHGPRRFAVIGTPSDCIVMAVRLIMKDAPPDLVISGVNRGANLADDIAYSGTVSGAMTSVLCGIPAIAFSQAFRRNADTPWETARQHGTRLLDRLLAAPLPADLCLNVNFPAIAAEDVTGIRPTRQGSRSIRAIDIDPRDDLRGKPYYWLNFDRAGGHQAPDSDIQALRDSAVSVTPLRADRTNDAVIPLVAELLA
ncbi:MAG: stationary phase survival protein SurE [Rhodospirillales bacterium]|nr:stationary phase survival protein SurE [Rhodospirillales bacterium]